MLCPNCGRRNLQFFMGDSVDDEGPMHPRIVAIKCNPTGTGSLSRCNFVPGSIIFNILVRMYWLDVQNERAVREMRNKYKEEMDTVIFELYDELKSLAASASAHQMSEKLKQQLHMPYEAISKDWDLDIATDLIIDDNRATADRKTAPKDEKK